MKNERGITLVELLAVLALVGIIVAIIVSVMINGMNTSKRNTTNQRLQQEANYIVEVIRSEYLKNEEGSITLDIEGNDEYQMLIMNKGKENEMKISDGYFYCETIDDVCETVIIPEISREENRELHMVLKDKKEEKSLLFEINTTLSKLH